MRSAIFAVLLGAACAASAQMYRWTDEKGRVHITDTPPPPTAKDIQRKSAAAGAAADENATLPFALQQAVKSFPVTLYTAPDCDLCRAARGLLNARGVPFREVLVTDEAQAAALKQVAGALTVPSVTVGSSVQKGFEEGAYHSLLDIAGYPQAGAVPTRNQSEPKPAPPAAPSEAAATTPAEEAAPAGSGPYAPGSSSTGTRRRK